MSVTVEVNAMFTLAPWCFILVAFLVMFELVKIFKFVEFIGDMLRSFSQLA